MSAAGRISQAVQRLLAVETGGQIRTPEEGVALAMRLHAGLAQHLAPVVGEAGFDALFARSLKKTKPAFPCLRDLETAGPAHEVLSQLYARLRKQEAAVVEEIVAALMVLFISLLSTFIGEGLAWKLLRNAWPEALPNEPPSGENQ